MLSSAEGGRTGTQAPRPSRGSRTHAGNSSRYPGVSLPGSQFPSFFAKTLLPFEGAARALPKKRADNRVGRHRTDVDRPDACMARTILLSQYLQHSAATFGQSFDVQGSRGDSSAVCSDDRFTAYYFGKCRQGVEKIGLIRRL